MNSNDFSPEQINKYISHFKSVWSDGIYNPMPDGVKLCIYCDNGGTERGFICNKTTDEAGFDILIAHSWIPENELMQLMIPKINK